MLSRLHAQRGGNVPGRRARSSLAGVQAPTGGVWEMVLNRWQSPDVRPNHRALLQAIGRGWKVGAALDRGMQAVCWIPVNSNSVPLS